MLFHFSGLNHIITKTNNAKKKSFKISIVIVVLLTPQQQQYSKYQNVRSYTSFDDVPPRQKPRNWGCEGDGDGNPNGKQSLVAEYGECECAAGGGSHLRRAVLHRSCGRVRIGARVGVFFGGNRSAHVELLEDGFDVDVIPDSDVEAGDGSCGDAQVNAQRYLPILVHQLAKSTTSGHCRVSEFEV